MGQRQQQQRLWAACQSTVRWLGQRKLELAVFLGGVLLRLTMTWNFDARWTYDADLHWQVVTWILEHGKVPHPESTFSSYHPPLYYAIAAGLVKLGFARAQVLWFSVFCGVVRLGLIWAGLEWYVRSRWARVTALAVAAVVAASVHLDGMVYPEALSGTLIAGAMLLVPIAFRRSSRARWVVAGAVGLMLGLACLTKVSGFVVLSAVLAAAGLEFFVRRRPWRTRLRSGLPWVGMLGVVLAVSGWYYLRNVREYGTPFVTSFELPSQSWLVAADVDKPLLDRRTLGFVFGWNDAVYREPSRPSGLSRHPRFFPVAVASTVVDYWGYSYQGYEGAHASGPGTPIRPAWQVRPAARLAVVGGTVIFLAAAVAWLFAARHVLRRRDMGRLALLLIPLATLVGALAFAIRYPVDVYGVIKGVYMTFGAPPVYALYGVAVGWSRRRPERWPLFGLLLVALWLVGAYSVLCRLGVPLVPFGLFES
jgi:4-amino-4-deoxy-L-arabinose transferase-like glycosyltransferase